MRIGFALLGLLIEAPRYGYELRGALSGELGHEWHLHFSQLYRALAALEQRGWVKATSEASPQGPRRKRYRVTAAGRAAFTAWLRDGGMLPRRQRDEGAARRRLADRHVDGAAAPLRAVGNDDLLLALVTHAAAERAATIHLSPHPVDSLTGLQALAERRADLTAIHLLDIDSGEYNLPFVRQLLPEEPVVLVTLAVREQGLMFAPGNPLRIRGVADLRRAGLRLCNRQHGAGTRRLLFHRLRQARVDPRAIRGWESEAPTHAAVARAIAVGRADVGAGLRAAAERAGLEFLPIGEERYDLVVPRRLYDSPALRPLRAALGAGAVRRAAAALPGYDVTRLGRVVARTR